MAVLSVFIFDLLLLIFDFVPGLDFLDKSFFYSVLLVLLGSAWLSLSDLLLSFLIPHIGKEKERQFWIGLFEREERVYFNFGSWMSREEHERRKNIRLWSRSMRFMDAGSWCY